MTEQVLRELVEAWDRQDLDAVLALVTDDVMYINPPMALEPGTRHGKDGLAKVAEAQWEVLDGMVTERVASRDGSLLSVNVVSGTIPGSDARLDTRVVVRWEITDGLVSVMEVLGAGSSAEEALRAAGLEGSP